MKINLNIGTPTQNVNYVWVNIDPRNGNCNLYSQEYQSNIEEAYQKKETTFSIPEYNATVVFDSGGCFQVTSTGGHRSVVRKEIQEGQTSIDINVEYNDNATSWYAMPDMPIRENPTTHIGFTADSSGSMRGAKYNNVTEKGVDEFLREQKKVENPVLLYAMTFSHLLNILYDGDDLKSIEDQTLRDKFYTITPSGTTAYYDAVMKTIDMIEAKYQDGDEVIMCIMTDGYDNSSKTSLQTMCNRIKAKKSQGWTITMVGTTDIDTENMGNQYGIGQEASIGMAPTADGAANVFRSLSQGVTRMRTGESAGLEFTSLERQQSAGVAPPQSGGGTQQQLYPDAPAPPPMPSLSRQ
tara:strand:+ start:952 stop:2010 length:1059 start_codon:yes stop_codon:yes gene_type:complete